MQDFATFNATNQTITFNLEGYGIGPGFYTAVVALLDWKDFNPYTLYVRIMEKEDVWVNTAPYFEDWEDKMPIKLAYGSVERYVFVFP